MNKQYVFGEQKGVVDEKNKVIAGAIGSSGAIDRMGESLDPMGWDLKNYTGNPVLLYGHDYSSLPVGKATKVWIEDGKLMFNLQFADTDMGNEVFKLYKDGFLNAFSVGFIPLEWDNSGEYTFSKMELLELSCVPVPANPEALKHIKSLAPSLYNALEEKKKTTPLVKEPEAVDHADTVADEIEGQQDTDGQDYKEDAEFDYGKVLLVDLTAEQFAELMDMVIHGPRNTDGSLQLSMKAYKESVKALTAKVKDGKVLSKDNEALVRHAVDDLNTILRVVEQTSDAKPEDEKEPQSGYENIPDAGEPKAFTPEATAMLKKITNHIKESDTHQNLSLKLLKQLHASLRHQGHDSDGERT